MNLELIQIELYYENVSLELIWNTKN